MSCKDVIIIYALYTTTEEAHLVLLFWIGQSISNAHTTQVEWNGTLFQFLIAPPDAMSNGGSVMSAVGFSDNVEWILRVLWKFLHEGL